MIRLDASAQPRVLSSTKRELMCRTVCRAMLMGGWLLRFFEYQEQCFGIVQELSVRS